MVQRMIFGGLTLNIQEFKQLNSFVDLDKTFDLKRLATAKLNKLLASVLDNLLRMSEGKEHATSLVDLKDTISNLSYWNQSVGGSNPLRRTK